MRLELKFSLKEKTIPLDYRRIFISFIKKSLMECNNGKYYEEFFEGTKLKDYSFSVILPNPRFKKEKILLEDNNLKMIVTASDIGYTGLILMAAFLKMKKKVFKLPLENQMILEEVRELKELEIQQNEILVQTALGTGLCIRDHNRENNKDTYLIYEDEAFIEKAKEVLANQAKNAGFSKKTCDGIEIEPLLCKKVLIYHYGQYIDTTTGVFKLKGSIEVLKYFCQAGMGSRSSAGFGQINLLKQ